MLNWLPESISTYGKDIDRLFYLIYYITAVSCVLVLGGQAWLMFRYRARKGGRAVYTHGNPTLEVIWTIVPTLVFVMLGFMSRSVWSDVRQSNPPTDMQLIVEGSQFNWLITYPGLDGRIGTEDDFKQENLLRVPVDRKVGITLTAKDVIHSFFLPHVRLKQDAVPGREIRVWFEATKTGEYDMPCAELCGFGHSNMNGRLIVLGPEEFDAWAAEKRALP